MSLGGSQDGYVQVAADGAGKKIDNSELTRDDGTVVERQRVVIGADDNPRVQAKVGGEAGDGYVQFQSQQLNEIMVLLSEIRDMLQMLVGHL